MSRDEVLSQKTAQQLEIERLSQLPTAPLPPIQKWPSGVLLSNDIEQYCREFKLLDPFKPENIKAASYELRVGLRYSVAGKSYPLNIGDVLTIPKFEVAVIEILETINMPRFLIGRWNIRTKWAYEGLIWVGGPQVDAGFRGLLFCPIWNLSNREFAIRSGEAIAVIDFAFTTPLTSAAKEYPWDRRSRFVFEDYCKPGSGLVAEVKTRLSEVEERSKTDRERVEGFIEKTGIKIDTVTAVMFTALGILTAAVTLFATKPGTADQYWWDPTMLWVSAITTIVALMAWVNSRSSGRWRPWVEILFPVLALLVFGMLILRSEQQVQQTKDEVQQLRHQIDTLSRPPSVTPNSR